MSFDIVITDAKENEYLIEEIFDEDFMDRCYNANAFSATWKGYAEDSPLEHFVKVAIKKGGSLIVTDDNRLVLTWSLFDYT